MSLKNTETRAPVNYSGALTRFEKKLCLAHMLAFVRATTSASSSSSRVHVHVQALDDATRHRLWSLVFHDWDTRFPPPAGPERPEQRPEWSMYRVGTWKKSTTITLNVAATTTTTNNRFSSSPFEMEGSPPSVGSPAYLRMVVDPGTRWVRPQILDGMGRPVASWQAQQQQQQLLQGGIRFDGGGGGSSGGGEEGLPPELVAAAIAHQDRHEERRIREFNEGLMTCVLRRLIYLHVNKKAAPGRERSRNELRTPELVGVAWERFGGVQGLVEEARRGVEVKVEVEDEDEVEEGDWDSGEGEEDGEGDNEDTMKDEDFEEEEEEDDDDDDDTMKDDNSEEEVSIW
ncbi:hypothetical protein F4778DRAFT_785913 [Xylariomycetidae sp. FL2044]|nr:hypothetical protein F4778DRAFT_785913 [Xylariomycetidae sp. FL2044]